MLVKLVKNNKDIIEVDFFELLKKSKQTLLFFYPKDNTPGCTLENIAFTKHKADFEKMWIQVVWVSKDSAKSHCNFMDKQDLSIDLISDEDLELHKKYDVLWEKKMFWKTYMWTIRSTFLLDPKGEIIKEYRKVKASTHVEDLLKELG